MKQFILSLTVIAIGAQASAWGPMGHRTTAAVAKPNLCQLASNEVRALLGRETLEDASTWADEARSNPDYDFLKPWHYANIPKGSTYDDSPKASDGDLVVAVEEQTEVLSSPKSSREEKLLALRLIVHFIGDAHMPLHAGRPEDRGGNSLEVEWMGSRTNMHALWDSGLLRKLGMTVEELARELNYKSTPQPQLKPENWIDESARASDRIYTDYEDMKDAAQGPSRIPRATDRYYERNIETVKMRIRAAGLRLAKHLNTVYGCR